DTGPGAEETGPDQAVARPASVPVWRRWRAAPARLARVVREHWIFASALAVAVLPRLVAMIGFQPGVLFQLDAYDYLWGAVHVSPNVVNPSGYSLFLWLLRPFHSIVLVVFLQHLLGLGIATMVYALARRYGLPDWGATLAAAPVLFDRAQILLEQFVMADLLAMALMVGAFGVLLLRKPPSMWQVVTAGVMTGASVTVRPTTLPLVLLIPLFLLLRRAGWRRAGASLLAGVIPVVAYMSWFAAAHGSFNMTNSNGMFLWSRTMSFAKCAVIKPPADLQALCPEAQPGNLARPDPSRRLQPKRYLWNRHTWPWSQEPSGLVPDTAAFTQANNGRALRFAIMAIEAQPFSYIGVLAKDSAKPFLTTINSLRFPTVQPRISVPVEANQPYEIATVRAYMADTQGVAGDPGFVYGTQLKSPYASLMNAYQRIFFLPGPVFALIMLTGLVGIILPSRRTAVGALLWVSAVILIVLPIAEHEYTYRYVLPTVPLACIAAAIALRTPGHEAAQT
ncbi:MAG: hypothetical protein J2P30_15120, partial [Actinobacteria bacterium]|nr:hypothetical protein [Actinomycetota bacterium]